MEADHRLRRAAADAEHLVAGDPATIEASTDAAGEILCRAKICQDALAHQIAGSKVLRIGGGSSEPMIRLHTGAAPILIEQVR